MKITNIDTFIEEFRNGRDIWSRASIELAVREIERLRKENNKLKVRLEASEKHLVLMEVNEMLKKTQARVQELEKMLAYIRDYSDVGIDEDLNGWSRVKQIQMLAEQALNEVTK
jgi:hypothetical protein